MFNKKMMEQAQKMMQDMSQAQAELSSRTFEGSSGGGAVTVQCAGDLRIQKIQIKPEAVDPEDVEMLEDLVLSAVNDALKKAQDTTKQEMGKLTGGLGSLGLGL